MSDNKKGLIYEYITEVLYKHADVDKGYISYKKARYVLSRFNLPKWLWMPIIKELIESGYLIRQNQQSLEIKEEECLNYKIELAKNKVL